MRRCRDAIARAIARTARKTPNFFSPTWANKINDNLENRFYLTVDQENRQLPGGLTQSQMQADPQQADPLAAPLDYSKQWYYVRLADKISYEKDGHELDASVYWWHRELKEKGFYDPADYEQGIQIYHADDGGIDLNSVTHSVLFGQQNILTIGVSPAFETEQDHNYANIGGAEGNTIAQGFGIVGQCAVVSGKPALSHGETFGADRRSGDLCPAPFL